MSRGPECEDGKPHKLTTTIQNDEPQLDCSKCDETWGVGNPDYRKAEDVPLPE